MRKIFRTRLRRILTVALILAVLTVPPIANYTVFRANAAGLTDYKVEIGDSRAGVETFHRFSFTTPSTTNIEDVTFQYCTTASGTCTAPTGMELTSSITVGTVQGIGGTGYSATGTDTTCTGSGNTDCTITFSVSSPGAQSADADVIIPFTVGITNPTTTNTTYFVRITTLGSGASTIDGPNSVAFAILTSTSIAVSASVDPNLTFSIAAVTSGGTVNSATTTVTSTASTIPFGTLTAGTPAIAAHDVTVTTNAGSGYTVTASASASPPLTAGSNNIDEFTGTNASPATWSEPGGSTANTNTGFFGYTTADSSLCTGTANRFTDTGNEWAGTSTVGGEVICSTTGVSSETTRVGWQVEVNAIQPAGSYTGTAILIATPTY